MFCKEKVEKKIDVSKNVEGGGAGTLLLLPFL